VTIKEFALILGVRPYLVVAWEKGSRIQPANIDLLMRLIFGSNGLAFSRRINDVSSVDK
jgi:DNA-binding transcriptional regulator YiaG